MATSFAEHASRGNALGALRMGLVNGALWAIGISWATAIRGVVRALLPEDTMDVVLGELLAAGSTTLLGVGVSVLATYQCFPKPKPPTIAPTRLQTYISNRKPTS